MSKERRGTGQSEGKLWMHRSGSLRCLTTKESSTQVQRTHAWTDTRSAVSLSGHGWEGRGGTEQEEERSACMQKRASGLSLSHSHSSSPSSGPVPPRRAPHGSSAAVCPVASGHRGALRARALSAQSLHPAPSQGKRCTDSCAVDMGLKPPLRDARRVSERSTRLGEERGWGQGGR
eukprot:3514455-Pleurochrysis_carterae.AAC.1